MITVSDTIKNLIGMDVFGVKYVVVEEYDMTHEWVVISGKITEIIGQFTINESKESNYKLTFIVQEPKTATGIIRCYDFDKEVLFNNIEFAKKVCDYLNKKDNAFKNKDFDIAFPSTPYSKESMVYKEEEK